MVQTVEAFAATLGLPATPARDGSFTFAFARSGLMQITPAAERGRALVSLAARPDRMDAATERRALERAGFDDTTSRFLHAGLAADGSIVFALALAEEECSLPVLEGCLQQLMAAHAGVR